MKKIPNGVYPVMITPYTEENTIDWAAVDGIVEFYARHGCQGIFAVCQSSELFFLTEDERAELAGHVVKASAGRMCVVASGHVSNDIDDQIRELRRIADAGVEAVVMISNRLAKQDEDDDVLLANMNRILAALPDVTFGMYECPYPYKRLLSLLSTVEACCYPVCAKYHMGKVGVPMTLISRVRDRADFNYLNRHEIDDLLTVEETIRELIAKI